MIEIEIDGNPITVELGARLIDIADANGISIPRFCYHKKLSVVANCRMCLVEVEKAPKPMPACATEAVAGMKIFTKSTKAIAAQKSVMEFLLINHPLDCPICDQGGECDLQDLAVAYGNDYSRFNEPKRIVVDKNLGSLISTDMTRCIHCTRCVRFGKEIAGIVELGSLGRGEHMKIGTFVEHALSSELSGNIIDLCPVGALTSKPFRFQARNWELKNTGSIAPHDALGSNIIIQSINNKIVRVLPDDNEAINEIWLSDRDRFSYLGLYTEDRLQQPMLRNKKGDLAPISWQNAFEIAALKLSETIAQHGANSLGMIMSPNSTVEEFYLANKIIRELGSNNISCRLRHQNTTNLTSSLSCKIADIENMQTIIIVGSAINQEIPLLAQRINKASANGAEIHIINQSTANFSFTTKSQTKSGDEMSSRLQQINAGLDGQATGDKTTASIIKSLQKSKNKALILIGQSVTVSSELTGVYSLVSKICQITGAELGVLDIGANTKGAMTAGLMTTPITPIAEIINKSSALILFNIECALDSGLNVDNSLANTDFILSCSSYLTDELVKHADLILPIANFGETSGTFINLQNDWQSFTGAVKPLGEARPGWKVLRVLANHLNLSDFEFVDCQQVLQECRANDASIGPINIKVATIKATNLIANLAPIYQTDSLVRRSVPLQKSQSAASNN